jgi:hypothetical protein
MSSSSEFYRQRDAQTFLQTWQAAQGSPLSVALNVDSIGAPDLRDANYKPQPSPDRTLNALAQLAVLRLDVKRCMVSLIDTSNQHILAEATRKLHLVAGDAAIASPEIEVEVLNSPKTNHDAELWREWRTLFRSAGSGSQQLRQRVLTSLANHRPVTSRNLRPSPRGSRMRPLPHRAMYRSRA